MFLRPRRSGGLFLACLTLLISTLIANAPSVSARETRTIAETYTIQVGFITEPPVQDDTNGVQVNVARGDQPIDGLEATLQVQAVFAGEARELPLAPLAGQPGVYTSVFIPTQPGEYSFIVTGSIEDQSIEETFHSSPDGVPLVASRLDYEFPTAAQGVVDRAASPVLVGGVLLVAGSIGFTVRRHHHSRKQSILIHTSGVHQ